MHIRRPIAAVVTALALVGGGATLTACGDPSTPNEGTTEEQVDQLDDEEADRENLPDTSNPEPGEQDESDNDAD